MAAAASCYSSLAASTTHFSLPRKPTASPSRLPSAQVYKIAATSLTAQRVLPDASTSSSASSNMGDGGSSFAEFNNGIAHFYDTSSGVWEDFVGEHMHHGFYEPGLPAKAALSIDHKQAQIRMIEESLKWAGIPDEEENKPQRIIDVGCGIGGSSRHLAQKYGAQVVGITLSPYQAQRATQLTSAAGLSSKVSFQAADPLNQPFPDEQFDFVWSMESGQYMPDKEKFMSELVRVTKPGGRILIVTCCHRELSMDEDSLKPSEQNLLDEVCEAYYLAAWCAPSKYVKLAQTMGLEDVRSVDWTEHITLFWPAVIKLSLSLKGMRSLFKYGSITMKGALAMRKWVKGYNSGLIKFALITARKPDA